MTKCQNPVKTCQMRPTFVGVTKIGMEISNMVIIHYVDIETDRNEDAYMMQSYLCPQPHNY